MGNDPVQGILHYLGGKTHGAVVGGVRYVGMNKELMPGDKAAPSPPICLQLCGKLRSQVPGSPAAQAVGIVNAHQYLHVDHSLSRQSRNKTGIIKNNRKRLHAETIRSAGAFY
jgi:hypothetical protein